VLNCGSSSIKFALFDAAVTPLPREPIWAGQVEGIGGKSPKLVQAGRHRPRSFSMPEALRRRVAARARDRRRADRRTAAHGGRAPGRARRQQVRRARPRGPRRPRGSEGLIALAPLHQPFALQAIETLLADVPDLPQVACFDTAFHRTLPPVEQMLPLPHALRIAGSGATDFTACRTNTWPSRSPNATATSRAGGPSSRTSAAARASARCTGSRASPRPWAFPRSTA
jgi:acetate kinase